MGLFTLSSSPAVYLVNNLAFYLYFMEKTEAIKWQCLNFPSTYSTNVFVYFVFSITEED